MNALAGIADQLFGAQMNEFEVRGKTARVVLYAVNPFPRARRPATSR